MIYFLGMETHFEGKVAQKAVIVRDGKVLVLRDPRMGYEIWELPGGRLNINEDPKAGLAREIEEELGISCEVGEVVHLAQFLQGNEQKNALMIAYLCKTAPEAVIKMAPEEVSEVRYITKEDMDSMKFFPEYEDTLKIYFRKMSL